MTLLQVDETVKMRLNVPAESRLLTEQERNKAQILCYSTFFHVLVVFVHFFLLLNFTLYLYMSI